MAGDISIRILIAERCFYGCENTDEVWFSALLGIFFKLTCILHRYFSLEHTFDAFWFVQIQGIQVFCQMVSVFDPFGELRLDTIFHGMIRAIGP